MAHRMGLLLLCLGATLGVAPRIEALLDEHRPAELRWTRVPGLGVRGELPHALARSRDGALLAVADEAGVTWWHGDRRERAALLRVRDLAFDAGDTLWIATERGLYRWTRHDRPQRRTLQGGETANRIHRLAASDSALLLATDAGAIWSSDGRVFQSLATRAGPSAATRVAIRPPHFDSSAPADTVLPPPRRAQAWVYGVGRLVMVRGLIVDQGLRVTDSRLVDLPRPSDERLLMDLAIDPDGQRLYMVFEDLIAWRSLDSDDLSSSASRWHLERPVMPPGARIRRLGWAAERVWLATDHGLLEAPVLGAPFARAASPLGTSDCADLQSRGSLGAVALCRPGLFVLAPRSVPLDASSTEATPVGLEQPAARRRASPPRRRESIPPDPPVGEIRRRALERAGLTVKRFEGLWKGLANRAYWPEVSLRFGMDSDRDRSRDADQSFVSGETRHLLDQSRDEGRSFDAAVEFDWDLGGISYPNESVDLSREHRQVISLRDDVIDEIHQIYFERQSIRERLAEEPSLEPEEIARLTTRARELEAGLDAWTGGWLSRWRIAHAAAAVREVAPSASGRSPRLDAWQGPDHPDP